MQLADIILASAQSSLRLQRSDGSFPPGHNGPYGDPETPVRNTGHWLIVLLKANEISGKARFVRSAERAVEFLCGDSARPMGATFWHRQNPEKDFCNGLIGQAWTIEALVVAAQSLENERCRRLAEKVFLLHPYNEELGLWRRVNVDGSYSAFDMTFNHQLWFAAAGSLLDADPDGSIGSRVIRFLDRSLTSHLRVRRSGRIIHGVSPLSKRRRAAEKIHSMLKPIRTLQEDTQVAHKEIGYHAFNIYAFSLLKERMPAHPLWNSEEFTSALHFVRRARYVRGLENNRFGYPYNPPGIETPFALLTFADCMPDNVESTAAQWLSRQLSRTFDFDRGLMQDNTDDPHTLAARIYEATRLPPSQTVNLCND
jgi:hypothetical protein